MTPLDLITQALKKTGVVGVGQTPQAEDVNDAFLDLNMMMGQWNRKRWLIYHLVELVAPATGASAYRIGGNQAFNYAGRVTVIESAFYRLGGAPGVDTAFSADFSADFGPELRLGAGGVDIPLSIIRSREDYSTIGQKWLGGFPSAVYLDADNPLGLLYVYPAPSSGEIHIVVQDVLSRFPDLSTDINLPAEYEEALLYNLSARLRPSYQKAPDPTITAIARASLSTIKVANAQVGILSMPDNLPIGGGWGRFNVMTGY